MAKKIQRGLGRGLGALLGEEAVENTTEKVSASETDRVRLLPIRSIDPNPGQPRKSFDEDALREMADSIKAVGILQPIIVCESGERFRIIAGERRYRAARLAELEEVPAIVRNWDEQLRMEAALVENLQRDDLNPIEEAQGIRNFMKESGLTQEKAAERLGKSRPAVANILRLLNLESSVQQLVLSGKLSAGHARALVPLDSRRQVQLANLAAEQGWSVRQLERICSKPDSSEIKPRIPKDRQFSEMEGMARNVFGTKAKISGTHEKGKLTLFYYSEDDLQRIWEILEAHESK